MERDYSHPTPRKCSSKGNVKTVEEPYTQPRGDADNEGAAFAKSDTMAVLRNCSWCGRHLHLNRCEVLKVTAVALTTDRNPSSDGTTAARTDGQSLSLDRDDYCYRQCCR